MKPARTLLRWPPVTTESAADQAGGGTGETPYFQMDHRDRVLRAIAHKEPDHVPLDLGGSDVTGIHRDAYRRLAKYLGFNGEAQICEAIQQVALPEEALLRQVGVDVRPLFPDNPDGWRAEYRQVERGQEFTDEWGVQWVMPQPGGLYFDMIGHPLAHCTQASEIRGFRCPDPEDVEGGSGDCGHRRSVTVRTSHTRS